MATDVNDLKDALAEAAEEEVSPESSPEENVEAAAEEDAEGKPKSKGAQDRIRQLVAERNKYKADLDAFQTDLKKKDSELGDMLKMLQAKESDSRTIQAIKDLHARDTRWRDTIEKLDKALKGEDVDLDDPKPDPAKGKPAEDTDYSKVKDLLKSTQTELEARVAEQRAQLILDKVDRYVDRFMDNLPQAYGPDDRRIIQETLADHMDWDAINEAPDELQKHVAAGVQKCINWYGQPKGAPSTQTKETPNGSPQPTHDPKARLDSLLAKDYGKAKVVDSPNGKRFEPVVSDDAFVAELAEAMRLARVNAGTGR